MSVFIDKEAAEKILYDGCHTEDGKEILDDVVEMWHMIQAIPAADVKPVVRGKWKRSTLNLSACSECGNCVLTDRIESYFFCPCCGAKMEVTQ